MYLLNLVGLLLLLCGDVEPNPGPPRRARGQANGDKADDPIAETLGNVETKLSGIEAELAKLKRHFDEKTKGFWD